MGDCPYAEADWYCAKQEGHEGPHESVSLGRDITLSKEPLCDCGHIEGVHIEPGILLAGTSKVMYEQWCTSCSCTRFVLEGEDPEEFDYIAWIISGRPYTPRKGAEIPFDQYVHVRYRLAESTDSRELWHYESMPQSWLPEYMSALRAKGHDRFAFRILRTGEPWWPVP